MGVEDAAWSSGGSGMALEGLAGLSGRGPDHAEPVDHDRAARASDAMRAVASVETWYVTSAMLAPIGYVVQDVVADAMTVEAVPRMDESGKPLEPEKRKSMHVTMQTLGRVAIISGGVLVSLMNVFLLSGVGELPEAEKAEAYLFVYELALIIPVGFRGGRFVCFLAAAARHGAADSAGA